MRLGPSNLSVFDFYDIGVRGWDPNGVILSLHDGVHYDPTRCMQKRHTDLQGGPEMSADPGPDHCGRYCKYAVNGEVTFINSS